MSDVQSPTTVGIVGARGLVGTEAMNILHEHAWPSTAVRVFGSERSGGQRIAYDNAWLTIEPLERIRQNPPSYVLLCADADTAREVTQKLLPAGAQTVVIDNSSAFRLDPGVPLVIPEINAELLAVCHRLIANPNCSTIMLLTAINPLRTRFGLRSIQVCTYQAVSGAGRAGLESLREQTRAAVLDEPMPAGVFPVPCAFDVFEHESPTDPVSGFNAEESKIIAESRRIWNAPTLSILPTCVRVPVQRSHAQAVTLELGQAATVDEIRSELARAPGVSLAAPGTALTPASIAGSDNVHIGRIRIDPDYPRRVLLWICCDQIRKGAALNAVQIMHRIIDNRAQSSPSPRSTSIISAPGYATWS